MGLELMDMCDEVWVFGFKITEGMRFELEHAREPNRHLTVCPRALQAAPSGLASGIYALHNNRLQSLPRRRTVHE